MSLQSEIADALAPTMEDLIVELGEQGRLRRRSEDRAADGSEAGTLNRVPGAAESIGLLPISRSASRMAEDWGRDRAVQIEAYIPNTVPIQEGDLVRLTTGEFSGQWVEAWKSRREPAGGVNLWAFQDAGDDAKLDALDEGF